MNDDRTPVESLFPIAQAHLSFIKSVFIGAEIIGGVGYITSNGR